MEDDDAVCNSDAPACEDDDDAEDEGERDDRDDDGDDDDAANKSQSVVSDTDSDRNAWPTSDRRRQGDIVTAMVVAPLTSPRR